MKTGLDESMLEKHIALLEKTLRLRYAFLLMFVFLIIGTLLELLSAVIFDSASVLQFLQTFRWSKLFFMSGAYLLVHWFILLRKSRLRLKQLKADLKEAHQV